METTSRNYKWLATAMVVAFWACIIVVLAFLMTGCRSVTTTESLVERQHIEQMMQKMDSVMAKSTTVQQDSSWHETFIRELQSLKERNDTSHTVVVDTAGNIIRERLEIWHERESTSQSDREEREYMMHRLEKMDSLLAVNSMQTKRIDSLMSIQQKEKTIVKDTPWYERWWNSIKWLIIGMILGVSVILCKKWLKN